LILIFVIASVKDLKISFPAIKDPSYLKWLIKNIDRIIQTGIPRNRYDPDIKELFEAGDFQKTN